MKIIRLIIPLLFFYISAVSHASGNSIQVKETDWLKNSEAQSVYHNMGEDRLMPIKVIGKYENGEIFYKGSYVPFPPNLEHYYTYWAMNTSWYEKRNNEFVSKGYKEIWHQTFQDSIGTEIHQAIWLKLQPEKRNERRVLESITKAEQNERNSILTQSESLLLASNFNELDRIADNFRTSKTHFIDGEWKLSVFYDGMSYYMRQAPEDNWINRLEKLRRWVSTKPNSITAHVALAECLVGYAFHGRGGAYSKDVEDAQWKMFNGRLKDASMVLEQVKNLKQKCPGWLSTYQRIALGRKLNKIKIEQLLDMAVAFEPSYNMYYFRTAWLLLPRWLGEEGDWERFAKSRADRVGGPDGDILYARIVWFIDRRSPKDVVDQNQNISWQRVGNGIQLMKKLSGGKLSDLI
jgi:hypothetical protein